MSSNAVNRVPAGVPEGGRFAPSASAESGVGLACDGPPTRRPDDLEHCAQCGGSLDEIRSPNCRDLCLRCTGEYYDVDCDVCGGDGRSCDYTHPGRRNVNTVASELAVHQGVREDLGKQVQALLEASIEPDEHGNRVADDEQVDRVRHGVETERWGSASITEGGATPWGEAQWVSRPAAGVALVSTAGHGGVRLSPARNDCIPGPLRNHDGWYEEDCEAGIAVMYHPDAFRADDEWGYETRERGEKVVKDWLPERYEAATGKKVDPQQSVAGLPTVGEP